MIGHAQPRFPRGDEGSMGGRAALCLLLTAATNPSLIGFLYLLAFGSWGLFCLPLAGRPQRAQAAKALWGGVCGVSLVVTLLQLWFQLVFGAGVMPGIERPAVLGTLRLVGFPPATSWLHLLALLAPPLLALLASALEVQAARREEWQRQQAEQEGTELRDIGGGARGGRHLQRIALLLPAYSNAGVAVVVGLLLAALSNPVLLTMPHTGTLLATLWRWGSGQQATDARHFRRRLLHIYTGLLLAVQYAWQVALYRLGWLDRAASWLGLYELSPDQPAARFVPELLQLLGLLLLFPAMGLAASASAAAADARSALAPDVPRLRSDGAAWGGRDAGAGGPLFSRLLALAGAAQLGLGTPRRQPAGEGSGAGRHGGLADSDVEEEPLLFSHSAPVGEWPPATPSPPAPAREPGRPPPAAGGAALPWRAIALPLLCELGVACFELACCRPAAVATLLCACSLIQPSAIGGGALVVGLSALLSQARGTAPALQRHSRPVCAALLLWALGCYIGTAVAPAAGSSQLLEALGLHAFQQEREQGVAGAPLLAMLVAAAAAGGLARAGSGGGNTSRGAQAQLARLVSYLYPRPRPQLRGQPSAAAQQDPAAGAAARRAATWSPGGALLGTPLGTALSTPQPGSPGRGGGVGSTVASPRAYAASPNALAADAAGQRAWGMLWHATLRLLWYLGFLVVPAAQFAVGSVAYDAAHGAYWAGLLLQLAGQALLRLRPHVGMGVLGRPLHRLLRAYASLHLSAAYAAYVGGLPGFGAALQPEGPVEHVLRLLGLWHPRVAAGMLPVLGILVLATLHAHIGAALHQQAAWAGAGGDSYLTLVGGVPSCHPGWFIWLARVGAVYGPASIVLLGYLLLLLDCPVGLLGLAYVLLLVPALIVQPRRGRFVVVGSGGGEEGPGSPGTAVLEAVIRGSVQGTGSQHAALSRVALRSSPAGRWLPLEGLALLAAADFASQALLPLLGWVFEAGAARDALLFLKDVVGLSYLAEGSELALRLLRPAAVLGALALYRAMYCLGTLHRQLQCRSLGAAAQERKRMAAQFGLRALAKRCLVLHGSKLVALCCFGAAMQAPGAVGWLLVAGTVLAAPLLGAVRSGTVYRRASLLASLELAEALGAAWLVAQYAAEVFWLQDLVVALLPDAPAWLGWAGLRLGGTGSAAEVEASLRWKALLLVAVAVKKRTFRWYDKLPAEVKDSAHCGAPCPLFWPPAPDHPSVLALLEEEQEAAGLGPAADGGLLSPRARAWQPMSVVQSLRVAVQDLRRRVGLAMRQALRAVDWPEPSPGRGEHKGSAGGSPGADPGHMHPPVATGGPTSSALRMLVSSEAQAFRFAAQEWVESFWQGWGIDTCLFLLLLAAFLSLSALSLAYMAAIAAGMACSTAVRQRAWRWLVLPFLGLAVVGEYSVLLGPPPLPGLSPPGVGLDDDIRDWLGIGQVSPAALWMLFLAFAATSLQVHYESWLACHRSAGSHLPAAAGAQQLTAPGSVRSVHSRASSFDGIDSPHTALLGRHHYFSTSASVGAEAQGPGGLSGGEVGREPSHTTHEYLAVEVGQTRVPDTAAAGEARPSADIPAGGAPPAGPTAAGVGTEQPPASSGSGGNIPASPLPPLVLLQPWAQQGPIAAAGEGSWAPGPVTSSDANTPFGPGGGSWRAPPGLWRPLSYDQRHTWRRVDWARFYFFRHYLDLVLVAVVALCTIENDIIHAGYLACALFFFRGRIELRTRRNRLFWWLPLYNYLVMLVTLVYQAPFQELSHWLNPNRQACSLAHLLGLYKLQGAAALMSLSYRGALADVVLWVVIRVQSRLFDSATYARVVEVVQQEEAEEKQGLRAELEWWVAGQAVGALEESWQMQARALRVEKLKASVASGFTASGIDPSMFDQAFLAGPPQQAQHARRGSAGGMPPRQASAADLQRSLSRPGLAHRRSRSAGVGMGRSASISDVSGQGGAATAAIAGSAAGTAGTAGSAGGSSGNLLTMTAYEREMYEAEAPQQAQQGAGHAGLPGAAAVRQAVAEASLNWGNRVWRWLKRRLRRVDRESYLCYLLYLLAFAADFSLLLSLFPLSMLLYSLVSIKPSRAYWQAALVYSEGIIIAQYAYLVPTRLACPAITPELARSLEVVGIHTSAARCIPLFLVYLATLMHNYGLATRHASPAGAPAALGATSVTPMAAAPTAGQAAGSVDSVDQAAGQRTALDIEQGKRLHQGPGDPGLHLAGDLPVSWQDARPGSQQQQQAQRGQGSYFSPSEDGGGGISSGLESAGEGVAGRVSSWVARLGGGLVQLSTAFWEFLCRACTVSERAPHFVLVTVRLGDGGGKGGSTAGGGQPAAGAGKGAAGGGEAGPGSGPLAPEALEAQLQRVLDGYRRTDITAARERQDRKREAALGLYPTSSTTRETEGEEGGVMTFDAAAAAPDVPPAPLLDAGVRVAEVPSGGPAPGSASPPAAGAAGTPPQAQQAQQEIVAEEWEEPAQPEGQQEAPGGAGGEPEAAQARDADAGSSPGGGGSGSENGGGRWTDLSRMGPLALRLHQVVSQCPDRQQVSALFEVTPLRSTPANSLAWCSVAGWPPRSLNPARDAAATLLRYRADCQAGSGGGSGAAAGTEAGGRAAESEAAGPAGRGEGCALVVVAAEHHSRQAQDWYAASAVVDFVAFIYVALFYQHVVSSARSLSEITNEHVVPLGYLLTLILLFMLIVLDRVVYTLGSPLGKALLHVSQLALYFGYCLSLFWSPLASGSARAHLRALLLVKCTSFVLGALQLRTGYPPPASYRNGMGRHSFVFMRHVSLLNGIAFQVFAAVPFLYELRELLDWSCTATTLTLNDWLKLEDINNSLFLVTCDRKARAAKRPGDRQPRYLKFFQGTLLFVGLLLLLWVPLLVFSSGNPTYTPPQVLSFHANATLGRSPVGASGALDSGGGGWLKRNAGSGGSGVAMGQARPIPGSVSGGGGPGRAYQQAMAGDNSRGHTSSRLAGRWAGEPPEQPAAAVHPVVQFPLYAAGDRRASGQWSGGDNGTLPAGLADYDPSQLQLLCLSEDADHYWVLTPPAQQSLLRLLGGEEGVAISFGWGVERDNPPPSAHGGPSCRGSITVPLAGGAVQELLEVVQGKRSEAQLLRLNASDPGSADPTGTGPRGLYPLLWLLRGDACAMRALRKTDAGADKVPRAAQLPDAGWVDQWVACNASLQAQSSPAQLGGGVGTWWRLSCELVDVDGTPVAATQEDSCGRGFGGPRLVAVLERVQTGIIGRTLSSYGIAGLYTVFVYGIGRFLRLSITNLRMRIPFEDLPNTRRLVALCQDIYIARAEGELGLEEQLYWTLISIYRLPSLMFELTKKDR